MSGNDSIDSSNPMDRIPVEGRLFMTLMGQIPKWREEAADAMISAQPDAVEGLSDHELAKWKQSLVPYCGKEIPVNIDGSDTFELSIVHSPRLYDNGAQDHFISLFGRLKKDGEPYAPPSTPKGEDADDSSIDIFITAEQQPFYTGIYDHQTDRPDSNGDRGTDLAVVEQIAAEGRQPLYLSTEACAALIEGLASMTIDPEYTRGNNDYLEPASPAEPA